jgi:FkbM family methyltransferase
MLKRRTAQMLLRLMPSQWKKTLSIYLGTPHALWSLGQLKRFGLNPKHVLDVGAFLGDWARICLSVFPKAHITCIEPQDSKQQDLRTLAAVHPNVTVIQALLGRENVPDVSFAEIGSGSSVLNPENNGASEKRMTTIDVLIGSGIIVPPEFLKLDVQGYEIEVLEGWSKGFETCTVIQCEISLLPLIPGAPLLHDVIDYLNGRGFIMFDVDELIRSPSDGAVWQIDALFCRADSPLRSQRRWRT